MYLSLLALSLLFVSKALGEVEKDEDYEEEDETEFAMNYLRQFHYISPTRSGNHDSTTAIKNFQEFFHLPVTGELDEETLHEMRKPRCGNPDVIIGGNRDKRYLTTGKWYKTNLTFYQEYGNDMSHADQRRIINRAFKYWSNVAPKLTFTRTNYHNQADLRISFGKRNHSEVTGEPQCKYPFDGRGNVLAHAYKPPHGRIHFDDDERFTEFGSSSGWWVWKKRSVGFLYTAVHEIGHALGLAHSDVKGSVMWPVAKKGKPKLHKDDIDGIRSLYG